MKIFLLEDDFSLNESIKDMLESENFIVDSFYDGKIALDNISGDYELFILDIFVPNLNGILLLEKIKKINKNSIVFIMSANIDIDTIKGAYLKGCDDYIKKPFNIQELLFKLAKFKKNSNIFKFDDQTLFDMETKKFIYNNSEIELTKNEKNFLHLLICNQGKCVNYTLIEDVVYDGEFKSLDAIRSLIKRLRKKLPKDIIFNNLDEGYFIK
ncbi:response regulator transcription factor [Aliarcobacter cryaerophilus]|uniref:response regulator transcription factor n=1 Tax=Aliarcobacter cryaerophilus TaxID=28198 RepID=UPI0021B52F9F|nr:response regulator transcription factor [Aliarcobacter cryaerophilus]MCT7515310.1 response regulator transcription factor [Aliarcobacter cryaerophilus]